MSNKEKFRDELIKFVDESILKKTISVDQFKASINIIRDSLKLKGPVDKDILEYLQNLENRASLIIGKKNRGIEESTARFFPSARKNDVNSKDDCYHSSNEQEVEDTKSSHYSTGCASDQYTYHYSSGC